MAAGVRQGSRSDLHPGGQVPGPRHQGSGAGDPPADPGSRSGLLPSRIDTGCFLVILITGTGVEPGAETVTATDAADPVDVAHRLLAAHIDGMAKKQPDAPVVPVKGQLPLFTLPGQLPAPEPATDAR